MIKRGKRTRYLGYLLFALLFVLISYEFHSAANRASNLELPDAAAHAVLRGVSEDEILPIRLPEKVSIRANVGTGWEHWSRKEARALFIMTFVFILCRFLFTILTVSIRRRFESPNLPFRRVLSYIQRQDGKGPGKLTFY